MTNPASRDPMTPGPTEEQRRRIRRTTVLLVLVVLAIYVAFLASNMLGAGT